MEENENDYQALASWLMTRLSDWRDFRDTNYLDDWDAYYRTWRGFWQPEDMVRSSEKSRIITPALQQAVEASVAELEEATFGRGKWFDIQDDMLDNDKRDVEYVRNLDIGLLRAISKNYKKDYLPPMKFVNLLQKRFTPYCSVATWYLWRSIDPEPIQY